jgi:hypothetical protein
MDVFTQRLPWDSLGTRTLALESDKLVMNHKNFSRSFTDDYDYRKIDPVFRTVRRGETEWSGVVYGLVVASIIFFVLSKMSSAQIFSSVVIGIQLCTALAAVYLIFRILLKKDHIYILDDTGDCIVALRSTPKARAFAAELKSRIEKTRLVR